MRDERFFFGFHEAPMERSREIEGKGRRARSTVTSEKPIMRPWFSMMSIALAW